MNWNDIIWIIKDYDGTLCIKKNKITEKVFAKFIKRFGYYHSDDGIVDKYLIKSKYPLDIKKIIQIPYLDNYCQEELEYFKILYKVEFNKEFTEKLNNAIIEE